MAEFNMKAPSITFSVEVTLTEVEAHALYDMAGYGTDAFLKVFYDHLGKAYLGRHETGVRTLFETIRRDVAPMLHRIKTAREAINGKLQPEVPADGS